MPLQFKISVAGRLRQLDLAGKRIVQPLPCELRSEGAFDPADVSLPMQQDAIRPRVRGPLRDLPLAITTHRAMLP